MAVMPRKFDELFAWAIDDLVNLELGDREAETRVSHGGRDWSICEVAGLAAGCDEPMQYLVYSTLYRTAPPLVRRELLDPAGGTTYAAGGQCLRRMYEDLKQRLADQRVWLTVEPAGSR